MSTSAYAQLANGCCTIHIFIIACHLIIYNVFICLLVCLLSLSTIYVCVFSFVDFIQVPWIFVKCGNFCSAGNNFLKTIFSTFSSTSFFLNHIKLYILFHYFQVMKCRVIYMKMKEEVERVVNSVFRQVTFMWSLFSTNKQNNVYIIKLIVVRKRLFFIAFNL